MEYIPPTLKLAGVWAKSRVDAPARVNPITPARGIEVVNRIRRDNVAHKAGVPSALHFKADQIAAPRLKWESGKESGEKASHAGALMRSLKIMKILLSAD